MVGWHNQLNGHEFEQAPGDGDGQEILACCSQWGGKGSDMTAPERQRPSFSATLTHGGGILDA